MKLFQVFIGAIVIGVSLAQPLTFCGVEGECRIPLNSISCEQLLEDFEFSGTCCSLESIPATGGCRVRVGGPGKGNCAWFPKCGKPCDPALRCNEEFRIDTPDNCPRLDFDALEIQAEADDTESCAPTAAPDLDPPTRAPTSAAVTVASFSGLVAGMLVLLF